MAIKLNSLARWYDLAENQSIHFHKGSANGERRIRLNLNMAGQTTFYIKDESEKVRFLTVAGPGLETIEFSASGCVDVFAHDGAGYVQYQTSEIEPTHSEVIDPAIFTKIANRRHRNPELEEVMYRMQANMERRFAQQADEFEAALERRRQEEINGRPTEQVKSDAPGTVTPGQNGSPVAEPQPGSANPGEGSPSPDGSQQPPV